MSAQSDRKYRKTNTTCEQNVLINFVEISITYEDIAKQTVKTKPKM